MLHSSKHKCCPLNILVSSFDLAEGKRLANKNPIKDQHKLKSAPQENGNTNAKEIPLNKRQHPNLWEAGDKPEGYLQRRRICMAS